MISYSCFPRCLTSNSSSISSILSMILCFQSKKICYWRDNIKQREWRCHSRCSHVVSFHTLDAEFYWTLLQVEEIPLLIRFLKYFPEGSDSQKSLEESPSSKMTTNSVQTLVSGRMSRSSSKLLIWHELRFMRQPFTAKIQVQIHPSAIFEKECDSCCGVDRIPGHVEQE